MLIVTMLLPITANAVIVQDPNGNTITLPEFEDTKTHWAKQAINQWQYYKVIAGVGKNKFDPDGFVTRRDFAVIIDKLFKYVDVAVNSFTDLELEQYYTLPMLRLNAAGIMVGDGKSIRPHDSITRQEAAVVICKAFNIAPEEGKTTFKDDAQISSWAYPYVKAMQRVKYINGGSDGNFNPHGKLTRAQAITIINNIINAFYNTSGRYTNAYVGNGFINQSSVTVSNSNITGNVYVSPGVRYGDTVIDNTIINGSIIHMGEKSRINITSNAEIKKVELIANEIEITNADKVGTVVLGNKAKTANLKGIPGKVVLAPGTKAVVDDVEFVNNGNSEISYTRKVLESEIAGNKGYIAGGPKVSMSRLSIDMDNNVKANDIQVQTRGDSEITEVGIIYNKNTEVPTLEDYDEKQKFEGNEADYASFYMVIPNQRSGETWTYRAYVKNKNGKVGYSNPLSAKSYSYEIVANVIDTKYEYDSLGAVVAINKKFEIFIHGSNIPKVGTVVALSNYNNGIEEAYTETNATLTTKSETSVYTKLSYTTTLKYTPNVNGAIIPHKFFGYRVSFGSDMGYKEKFPTFTDNTKIEKDVDSVVSGEASFSGDSTINIVNNRFTEGTGAIVETGVVILESYSGSSMPGAVSSSQNWQKYKSYAGSGVLNPSFNVQIDVAPSSYKVYYYAAYVKTTSQTTYGNIKMVSSPSIPVFQGVKHVSVGTYKTNAIVELNVVSSLPINVTGSDGIYSFTNTTDGKTVEKYSYKPIEVANPTFSNNVLKLTFTDLEPNKTYTVRLRLANSKGLAPEAYFTFNTNGN